MNNIVKNVALVVVFVKMVSPQFPIQVRYQLFILALCLPFAAAALKSRVLQWQAFFTVYAIALGAIFVFQFQDGTLNELGAPLPDLVIAALAVFALRERSSSFFLVFASLWSLIQLGGVIDEHFQGALWPRLPFAIARGEELEKMNDYLKFREAEHRYGAFTFESSAVGGIAGFFAVVALLMLTAPRRAAWRIEWTTMAWLIVAGAIAINVLAETKSGAFTMIGFVLPFVCGQALTGGLLRVRLLARISALVAGIIISGLLIWHFAQTEQLKNYVDEEIEHAEAFLRFGIMNNDQEGGLGTRAAYLNLAFQGLPYHPFGTGATSGYSYIKPVLNTVTTTPEIDRFFADGTYEMLTPFCTIIADAGLLGLLVLWLMLREGARIMCPYSSKQTKVWIVAGLCSYIIYINTVGLSPYWAMFIFLIEAAGSCYRRPVDAAVDISGREPIFVGQPEEPGSSLGPQRPAL